MAEQTDDLLEHIEEAAQQPKRVSGDQGSVEQFSLDEKIKADRYARSQRTATSSTPLRLIKMIPPGQD